MRGNAIRSTILVLVCAGVVTAATRQTRYYAHETVEDEHGVIAPWYKGSNGQIDERIRIAVETLKRYPWSPAGRGSKSLPEYIYNGSWRIDRDGKIAVPDIDNWATGDTSQRAAYVMGSLIDYYRYSGNAWAIGVVAMQADQLLDDCLTPDDHPWPRFLISVPVRGKPYGKADPTGFMQLDIAAEVGIQMVRAAQLCRNERYMEAAKHWADLLAAKRIREKGVNPWPRYANPQDVPWGDVATGGVAFILEFFDELIKNGYTGENDVLVKARQAGVEYLRDVLLPNWLAHDAWGRNYWDWNNNVQAENVTEFVCRYMMDHPDEFLNWRFDVRNILTLFINRTSACPGSAGDTFSGAWAYPESSGCCGRSLWYGPMELVQVYGQYAHMLKTTNAATQPSGIVDEHAWASEMARRQMILATYDFLPTGVVEDGIDGGPVVAGGWFKIAHPMALKHCLAAIAWQPELFAPPGENHIVRSSALLTNVAYERSRVGYKSRIAGATQLRLSSVPTSVMINGKSAEYKLHTLQDEDVLIDLAHPADATVEIEVPQVNTRGRTAPAFGAGGGPTGPQRWIFGYPERKDYIDAQGNAWRPATEWCVRVGRGKDTVANAWYTTRRQIVIGDTSDPEIYRYGAHAPEFWADVTVAPGTYQVRLKFAEFRNVEAASRAVTVLINGEEVVSGLDIAGSAAGSTDYVQLKQLKYTRVQAGVNRAVDLVIGNVKPRHGIVSVRLKGTFGGEAIVQAMECSSQLSAISSQPEAGAARGTAQQEEERQQIASPLAKQQASSFVVTIEGGPGARLMTVPAPAAASKPAL